MEKKRVRKIRKDKNIRDKLLASFIIAVGFWLLHISASYDIWFSLTILALFVFALFFILFFSIKAIKQKEKILGWTYLVMDVIVIVTMIIIFFHLY